MTTVPCIGYYDRAFWIKGISENYRSEERTTETKQTFRDEKFPVNIILS